jgi:hypothetical protein
MNQRSEKAGFEYVHTAAIELVLNNAPNKARLIAQYLRDLVSSQLNSSDVPFPPDANGLSEFFDKSRDYGFVLGNYETVARQIEVLLDFEHRRKLRNSRKRK